MEKLEKLHEDDLVRNVHKKLINSVNKINELIDKVEVLEDKIMEKLIVGTDFNQDEWEEVISKMQNKKIKQQEEGVDFIKRREILEKAERIIADRNRKKHHYDICREAGICPECGTDLDVIKGANATSKKNVFYIETNKK